MAHLNPAERSELGRRARDDGGATWSPVGNDFGYDGVPGTHQWYDGTPARGSSRGSGISTDDLVEVA